MAGNSGINNTYAVPAGQMLVIQEVSSLCGASEWRMALMNQVWQTAASFILQPVTGAKFRPEASVQ